jgi:hypothetical protein
MVTASNTLVLVLLASREHAHDMLLVSVLVLEVELKLSIDVYGRPQTSNRIWRYNYSARLLYTVETANNLNSKYDLKFDELQASFSLWRAIENVIILAW